jgi:hypothetical protein
MVATIELPNNPQELNFILELFKRLNVRITFEDAVEDDVLEEHALILKERREAMKQPDAQFFTLGEVETQLTNRKTKN